MINHGSIGSISSRAIRIGGSLLGGGGGGGVPSWVTANTSGPGDWYKLPNTSISLVNPPTLPSPLGSGINNKLDSWVSLAVDIANGYIYAVAGGGHGDYSGNEVNRLSLFQSTPSWTELRTCTLSTTADVSYYADGRPTSRHSYYGTLFNALTNRVMLVGGARYGNGAPLNAIDAFNISTNDYLPAGSFGDLPGVQGAHVLKDENRFSGIDERNGNIYTLGNNYLVKMDGSTGVVSTLRNGTAPIQGVQTGAAWDTSRNYFFFTNVETAYTPDTDTFNTLSITGSAAGQVVGFVGEYGIFYYAPLDSYFVRLGSDSGGTVYQVNASTRVATSFTTSGGSLVPAAPAGHLFYKFFGFPTLKGAILIPSYASDAWYLRLEA